MTDKKVEQNQTTDLAAAQKESASLFALDSEACSELSLQPESSGILFISQPSCRYQLIEHLLQSCRLEASMHSEGRLTHEQCQGSLLSNLLVTASSPLSGEAGESASAAPLVAPLPCPMVDIVVMEGRILEAFEDLNIIEKIRALRPFVPILLISANDSLDYKLAAYESGASDYLDERVDVSELAAKVKALHHMARCGRLIEVQNAQLVSSLSAMHLVNARLQEEMQEKERAQEESKKTHELLFATEKMASLGEMAGGIAHEINNPLAIIFGLLDIIQARLGENPPGIAEALRRTERVYELSRSIASIIKGLTSFSRNGDKDPCQEIDPRTLIDSILVLCSERYGQNDIKLAVDIPATTFPIECRSVHLSQVLVNLLNNSFDAVKGSPGAWVRLSLKQTEERSILWVEDSGPGIPAEVRKKMWDPFFTTKEVGKGTGLGLAISRGLIADHGGSLSIDGDCNHTRFIIELPNKSTEKLSKDL